MSKVLSLKGCERETEIVVIEMWSGCGCHASGVCRFDWIRVFYTCTVRHLARCDWYGGSINIPDYTVQLIPE